MACKHPITPNNTAETIRYCGSNLMNEKININGFHAETESIINTDKNNSGKLNAEYPIKPQYILSCWFANNL